MSIEIKNWTCNDLEYTVFDFSRFTEVESIDIGDNCFGSVRTFRIDGLNRLKSIRIGKNSFTELKSQYWEYDLDIAIKIANDESKSFHILNCESLKSIEIGEFSFSDFAGEFELKNLPQLQSIHIGTVGNDSMNFCYSSFVIQGNDIILNI